MVKAQIEYGHDAQVFCLDDEFFSEDVKVWPHDSIKSYKNIGSTTFGFSTELPFQLRSHSADVFHLHGIWNFASLATRLALNKKPLIISPRGMLDDWILSKGRIKKLISAKFVERPLLQRATIHALSESERHSVLSFHPKATVFVSPNAVTLPLNSSKTWDRKEKFKLCYLGRLHPKKGIKELILAISKIRPELRQAMQLNVFGWGDESYIKEIQAHTAEHNLEDTIFFKGPVQGREKEDAFLGSHAFILPSYSEGLPMAVLEAAAYGLPCILTKECNLPEFFQANAALQCTHSPESIASSIEELLTSDTGQFLSQRAKELVAERFSWNTVLPDVLGAYSSTIFRD